MDEVTVTMRRAQVATGDFVLHVSLTRKSFAEISNVLLCRDKMMPVVVEGYRLYCWACDASGHMSKYVPTKTQYLNLAKQHQKCLVRIPMVFGGRWQRKDGSYQALTPHNSRKPHSRNNNLKRGRSTEKQRHPLPQPPKGLQQEKDQQPMQKKQQQ